MVAPLKVFINEERDTEDERSELEQGGLHFFRPLERGDRERHGETARQQDHGVYRTDDSAQFLCRDMKVRGMCVAVDRIDQKEAAEQENLSEQEKPHADLGAGIVAVFIHESNPKF